jgi:aminoglycoside phosphotransferase (APT) family kinase protein
MSTVGHPLSDLVNLLTPFLTAQSQRALSVGRGNKDFIPGAVEGLPTREQVIEWYAETAGWGPKPELTWGDAFGMYRSSIIMQGIAARHALRQASSEKAKDYADQMKPFAEISWDLVQEYKKAHERAKL